MKKELIKKNPSNVAKNCLNLIQKSTVILIKIMLRCNLHHPCFNKLGISNRSNHLFIQENVVSYKIRIPVVIHQRGVKLLYSKFVYLNCIKIYFF